MEKNDNQNLDEDLTETPADEDEYTSGEDYREKMEGLQPSKPEGVTWKQKLAVVFLIVFGVSAMVLWMIQFKSGLQITQPLTPEELANLDTRNQEQVLAEQLRNMDTDEDGLSDYDELYFYNTSPYLEDTDSDGINDKQELEQGEDPNCPLGQECFGGEDLTDEGVGESNEPEAPEFDTEGFQQYLEQSQSPVDSAELDLERQLMEDILKGEADADSLRQLLKQAGMDEEMLGKISDEQLLETYRGTLQGK